MAALEIGGFYKHRRMTDVCMEVVGVMPTMLGYQVVVLWWNVISSNPYILGPDTLNIKRKDLGDWEVYERKI